MPRSGRTANTIMGIILMPEEIVSDELASGKLRRIMPAWRGTPMPVYAITETRLLPAKTQRFIEFLRARFGRQFTRLARYFLHAIASVPCLVPSRPVNRPGPAQRP